MPDLLVSGCVDARPCSIFMFGRRMTRTRTWSKSALIVSRRNFVGIPSATWTRIVPYVPLNTVLTQVQRLLAIAAEVIGLHTTICMSTRASEMSVRNFDGNALLPPVRPIFH